MEAVLPWVLRVVWILQPLTVGLLVGDALADAEPAFARSVSIALWVIWALVVLATFVALPVTLTVVRVVTPAALAASIWAAADSGDAVLSALGISAALASFVVAVHPTTGDVFVDGASYGDERRYLLRVPGPLLVGPLPLTWALGVGGAVAGPLLLAGEYWIPGALLTIIGWPVAALAFRSIHRLALRWLVFVPAGFVVHDRMALREPVLFTRSSVIDFGPAPADTDARDLTQGALGHALQADLGESAHVGAAGPDGEDEAVDRIIFTPARPGAAMAEARRRQLVPPTAVT